MIIGSICDKIDIPFKTFIEFGVEDYTESNTRFLLINNNWSGLVLDGSKKNVDFIRSDFIYWKYDLTAYHSFITRDNINDLIKKYSLTRDVGLLSIDIDGNDYWIWDAITCIQPRIVVCEYNSVFGDTKKVTVPYVADFNRSSAHFSELYFGSSLAAFCFLAEKKGYDFIGTSEAGVNAFFVRKDLSKPFRKYTSENYFRESANRDSKLKNGALSFLRHADRLSVIKEMEVVNVENSEKTTIRELYGL